MNALARIAARPSGRIARRTTLVIGLVNNMPDAALAATERQFAGLLQAAAGPLRIELRLFALEGVPRSERTRAQMEHRYQSAETLPNAGLDGLIVTGAEPRAPELDAEAYWPALARVVDWTKAAGVATIWSCLAAHAAVLRSDGVRRRALPAKLSGVFESETVVDDPLLAAAARPFLTPHSRLNGLAEADLTRRGFEILTRSAEAGVDAFARRCGALALYLQGHPEYDADTLKREYLRDVGRFLRGERPTLPPTPRYYFGAETQRALEALAEQAALGAGPAVMSLYAETVAEAPLEPSWRASAISLYRNWLAEAAGVPGRSLRRQTA